jgi:hypothetical protein
LRLEVPESEYRIVVLLLEKRGKKPSPTKVQELERALGSKSLLMDFIKSACKLDTRSEAIARAFVRRHVCDFERIYGYQS